MDVVGVEERHEDVDVEERDPAHRSSRRRLTSAIVGRGLPFFLRARRGTPFRTRAADRGSSALRASSDRTFPAVVERLAAICFAA